MSGLWVWHGVVGGGVCFLMKVFSFKTLYAKYDSSSGANGTMGVAIGGTAGVRDSVFKVSIARKRPLRLGPFVVPRDTERGTIDCRFTKRPAKTVRLDRDNLVAPGLAAPTRKSVPFPLNASAVVIEISSNSNACIECPIQIVDGMIVISDVAVRSTKRDIRIRGNGAFGLTRCMTVGPDGTASGDIACSSRSRAITAISPGKMVAMVKRIKRTAAVAMATGSENGVSTAYEIGMTTRTPVCMNFPFSSG